MLYVAEQLAAAGTMQAPAGAACKRCLMSAGFVMAFSPKGEVKKLFCHVFIRIEGVLCMWSEIEPFKHFKHTSLETLTPVF